MKDRIIKNYLKYNSYNNCSKEQMVFQDSAEYICLVMSPTFKLVKHLHKFSRIPNEREALAKKIQNGVERSYKEVRERLLGRRQRN